MSPIPPLALKLATVATLPITVTSNHRHCLLLLLAAYYYRCHCLSLSLAAGRSLSPLLRADDGADLAVAGVVAKHARVHSTHLAL